MLRLAPPDGQRLEQAERLELAFGGAESNVAINLARLGKTAAWYSRLPDHPLGRRAVAEVRKHGVHVESVTWAPGERLGVYFIEYGPSPRGIQVWYDRAGSAASRMQPADLPLDVLGAARWLHVTGITPALSASCAETTRAAVAFAAQHGLTISFDVNYRAGLWTPQTAAGTLAPFCRQAHYVFVAARDAAALWGAPEDASEAAAILQREWGGAVLVTRGSAGAVCCEGGAVHQTAAYSVDVADRIGAGDAFAAGAICRLLEGAALPDAQQFGAALAALKLTIPGDTALVTRAEVETLLASAGSTLKR